MREPFCWFSLPACVIAVFAQWASARQQSGDLAASPIRNEALAQAAVTRESPNGAPAAPKTASRPTTSRKEAPASGQAPKGATAARESQNRSPSAHDNHKKEPPAARDRRHLHDYR